MSWANGVVIDQFHLHGGDVQRPSLLASLDAQQWPFEDGEQIVVIQSLTVQGQWWEIGQKVADAAQTAVATPPLGETTGSASSTVKVFADTLALLTEFAVDVSQGALNHWYWQAMTEQPTVTVADWVTLLNDHPSLLPPLLQRLSEAGQLQALAVAVPAEQWRRLYQRQLSFVHLTPPDNPAAQWATPTTQAIAVSSKPHPSQPLAMPAPWQAAQTTLDQTVGQPLPIFALSWLWLTQPARLNKPVQVWHDIAQCYQMAQRHQASASDASAVQANATQTVAKPTRRAAPFDDRQADLTKPAGSTEKTPLTSEALAEESTGHAVQARPEHTLTHQPTLAFDLEFTTHSGGTFFLINAALQTRLVAHFVEQNITPWFGLYRLAQSLGELDDAMTALIAFELDIDANVLAALPPFADEAAQLARLARFYQRDALWDARLIHLPARIKVQGPNLLMQTDLSQVRTDVRLRGLDIDPGWQPWLGQVVRFEFDRFPEFATRLRS